MDINISERFVAWTKEKRRNCWQVVSRQPVDQVHIKIFASVTSNVMLPSLQSLILEFFRTYIGTEILAFTRELISIWENYAIVELDGGYISTEN